MKSRRSNFFAGSAEMTGVEQNREVHRSANYMAMDEGLTIITEN
jgi:hypothetical protein